MVMVSRIARRLRLVLSCLALAGSLAALAVHPAKAADCEFGCWGWEKGAGCYRCVQCCVYSDESWECHRVDNLYCNMEPEMQ